MTKKSSTTTILYIISIITLIGIGIFVSWNPMSGHDSVFHLFRLSMMAEEIQNHHFTYPIRILSASCYGYGYGAPLFYGDIFLYIPALLVALGCNLSTIYKLFLLSIFIGTFLFAFFAMLYLQFNKNLSLLFAIIYMLCPACIYDFTIRGAYGESLAYMLLPLIFSSFYAIMHDIHTQSNWIILSMSMSLLLLSHNISFVLVIICLLFWCILEWKLLFLPKMWKKHLFPLLKSAIVSFLCTISFSVPMLEQIRSQTFYFTSNTMDTKTDYFNLSLSFTDFFFPKEMQQFFLQKDITDRWLPGASIYLIIITVVTFLTHKKQSTKKQLLLLIIIIIAEISMGKNALCLIISNFLYNIQFSWRLLPFISFFACFLIIKMLNHSTHSWDIPILLFTFFFYFLFSTLFLFKESEWDSAWIVYDTTGADDLYLPYETTPPTLYLHRGVIVESNYTDVVCDFYRDKGVLFLNVSNNNHSDSYLDVPLHMYKGYVATTSNQNTVYLDKTPEGLIRLFINDYNGSLQVEYVGTLCQKVCDWISAITILFFLIMIVKNIQRSRHAI